MITNLQAQQDDNNTGSTSQSLTTTATSATGNGDISHHPPSLQQIRQSSKDSTGSSDTDSSSDDESMPGTTVGPLSGTVEPDKVQQTKETEAGAEISALVNYVQPVHFSSFENSESELFFSLCLYNGCDKKMRVS